MNPRCGVATQLKFVEKHRGALPDRIGWWMDSKFKLPGLSRNDTGAVVRQAFALAEMYVPLDFYHTRKRDSALIVLCIGPASQFDGVGDVLAMADMLSLYDPQQRFIWFDPSETWGMRAKESAVLALPVLCHEIGHTLGFGHGRSGLMAPYYDPCITTPTKTELRLFYGRYPELKS
jgi:hypothetical protein